MEYQSEKFPNKQEAQEKHYPEEVYWRMPEIESEFNVPRVTATRLVSGKDMRLEISQEDRLSREGWYPDTLNGAKKGHQIFNSSGQLYEVLEVKGREMRIKDTESDFEGRVIAKPMKINAQEYVYKIRGNNNGLTKTFKLYDTLYKDKSLDTTDFLDELVSSIPAQCIDVFDEIQIHRMDTDKGGQTRTETSLFAKRRILFLYISPYEDYPIKRAKETLYHELGHLVAKELKGSAHPGPKWKKCMDADGGPVSKYAAEKRYANIREDHGEVEDFADEFMMYVEKDAAKDNKAEPLRNIRKACFGKLDEVFEELAERQRKGKMGKIKRQIFKPKHPLAG